MGCIRRDEKREKIRLLKSNLVGEKDKDWGGKDKGRTKR